jgi:phage terminase large subunit
MLDYKIIVEDSPNVEKELNLYQWNDKKSGIPIDKNYHRIDWIRYGFSKLLYKPSTPRVSVHSYKK